MSLLAGYLSCYHPVCSIEEDRLEIRGVRYLSDPRLTLSGEYVYIGKAEGYFSDQEYAGACILASGKNRLICYDCDYEELLNDILAAFDFYNEWEQSLRQASVSGVPLEGILKIAAQVIRNPIMVFDPDGNLLAQSRIEQVSHWPGFGYIAAHHHMGAANLSMKFVDETGRNSADLEDFPQLLFRADSPGESAVALYLSDQDERLGFCLVATAESAEIQMDLQLTSFLAPHFLKASEFTGEASGLHSNVSILSQLLSGAEVGKGALVKFAESTQIHPPWNLLLLKNITIQNHTQRSMLIRDIKAMQMPCFPMEYEDGVLILVQEEDREKLLEKIDIAINLSRILVGVSMPLGDLMNVPMAYRQAKFALERSSGSGVSMCRDYALPYLLDSLRKQEMALELIHPAITALEQYDKENQTDFLKTLAVYILHERNQVLTAQLLHIHRNTLKYRLERIRQISSAELDDLDERSHFYLSVLMYGMESYSTLFYQHKSALQLDIQ